MHKKNKQGLSVVGKFMFMESFRKNNAEFKTKDNKSNSSIFCGGGPSESSFPLFAAPDFATIRGEAFLDKGSSVVR